MEEEEEEGGGGYDLCLHQHFHDVAIRPTHFVL